MPKRIKENYHWVIVAAGFILCFTGIGFVSGNKGLFLAAVSEALDISRSAYAINDSLRFITAAVANLFFGVLMVKFGPRVVVSIGIGSLILSCVANSLAESVWGIYLGGMFLGLGLAFGGTTFVAYMIRRWCTKNQGTLLGLALCANALGTAVTAPWFSSMIYSGDVFGYRNAYRAAALILLIVGVALVFIFRDAPKDKNPQKEEKQKSGTWEGVTLKQALRKPYFYLACGCIFLTGIVLQSVSGVSAAHMKDQGLDAEFVATSVSIFSLSLAACKFLSGFLYDKKGLKFTVLICDTAAVVMIVLLALVSGTVGGRICAIAYAVLSALALPLETVMLPLIAGDLFGEKEYSKMLGIFVSVNTAGYAVGPLVSNACFDMIGTYRPVFFIYAAVMAGVTVAFLFVHRQVAATRMELSQ